MITKISLYKKKGNKLKNKKGLGMLNLFLAGFFLTGGIYATHRLMLIGETAPFVVVFILFLLAAGSYALFFENLIMYIKRIYGK